MCYQRYKELSETARKGGVIINSCKPGARAPHSDMNYKFKGVMDVV